VVGDGDHLHLDTRGGLRELAQYDYGWSGFNVQKNKPHIDVALPNKLFEYINSGIAVAASDLPEMKRIVAGYRLGTTFDPENPRLVYAIGGPGDTGHGGARRAARLDPIQALARR